MGNACNRIKFIYNDNYVKIKNKKINASNAATNNPNNPNNPYNYKSPLCKCKYKNGNLNNQRILICEYCYERLDKVLFI